MTVASGKPVSQSAGPVPHTSVRPWARGRPGQDYRLPAPAPPLAPACPGCRAMSEEQDAVSPFLPRAHRTKEKANSHVHTCGLLLPNAPARCRMWLSERSVICSIRQTAHAGEGVRACACLSNSFKPSLLLLPQAKSPSSVRASGCKFLLNIHQLWMASSPFSR